MRLCSPLHVLHPLASPRRLTEQVCQKDATGEHTHVRSLCAAVGLRPQRAWPCRAPGRRQAADLGRSLLVPVRTRGWVGVTAAWDAARGAGWAA